MRTLRARVAGLTVLVVALAFAIAGSAIVAGFARSQQIALEDGLRERADLLRTAFIDAARPGGRPGTGRPVGGSSPTGTVPETAESLRRAAEQVLGRGFFVLVRGGAGDTRTLLGDGPASLPPDGRAGESLGFTDDDGRRWQVLTVQVGPGGATLEIGGDVDGQVEDAVAALRRRVIGIGGIAALLSGLVSFAAVGLAIAPLRRLRDATVQVAATEDLSTRVATDAPTEVAAVAAGFNTMLERLQRSAEGREAALHAARRFAADAGHELRTPLTAMRANLDALKRNPTAEPQLRAEMLDELLTDQERLTELLTTLQALARAEAGHLPAPEDVDLIELVGSAVDAARQRHPDQLYEVTFGDRAAVVRGAVSWLRSIVDNLLTNAAVHGGPRAAVHLGCETGWVVLVVDDDGEGIAPADRQRVLARFERGADSAGRPGSGLGLSLVAQLAALHGGTVRIDDAPSGGARFTVRLPAADATLS